MCTQVLAHFEWQIVIDVNSLQLVSGPSCNRKMYNDTTRSDSLNFFSFICVYYKISYCLFYEVIVSLPWATPITKGMMMSQIALVTIILSLLLNIFRV